MRLDPVHDIQNAYRTVLSCMSMPGTTGSIKAQADKIDIETGCLKATALMMLMLIDTEVTFNIVSNNKSDITRFVNRLTYAKAEEPDKADYIFILKDAGENDLTDALERAYTGNLIDPHQSAFIIIEANSLVGQKNYVFSGPGIENENYVSIDCCCGWMGIREKKNEEYPLGIDIIFLDSEGNIVCVPRTTRIKCLEDN